jgi:murein DD-endopeptidase MepM/ murein hydrolase activator NlpD
MRLRYIQYAGGNFRSCQNAGPAEAQAAPESSAPPRAARRRARSVRNAAPEPVPARLAGGDFVEPATLSFDLVSADEVAAAPLQTEGPRVHPGELFAAGDIPDGLLFGDNPTIRPFAARPDPAAGAPLLLRKSARIDAPPAPAIAEEPTANAPPPANAAAANSAAADAQPPIDLRKEDLAPQQAAASTSPPAAATAEPPPPPPQPADPPAEPVAKALPLTQRALIRLPERPPHAPPPHRRTQREADRRSRKEALAVQRRLREAASEAKRSTERVAAEARRRSRLAAKEAARRERALNRERRRLASPAEAARRSRRMTSAANVIAALGLLGALAAVVWYFAAGAGQPEQMTHSLLEPRFGNTNSGAARRGVPRPSQGALLSIANVEHAAERKSFERVTRVQHGDNFFTLLMRSGVPGAEAQRANVSLAGVYDVRKMRAGQLITVEFGILAQEHNRFLGVHFDSNFDRTVSVQRQARGDFVATEIKKQLITEFLRSDGVINDSLFQAGLKSGLQPEPVVRLINLFSYDVDFQRDVQKGDGFAVLIERHRDQRGGVVRYGDILFTSLTLQGQTIKLYRWQGDDGEADYFSESGESHKRALMRTPVDSARLSSGFGFRRHPILGYSKMHQGVDFSAPTGTPIFAAGSGHIEKIGWQGGYGNAIIIKHTTRDLSTLYAHMSSFMPGLTVGRRVRQGEVIGYVGSTGLSSGPHLHYEIHQGGKPIDPLALKLPSRQRLQGAELTKFLEMTKTLDRQYTDLAKNGAASPRVIQVTEQAADNGCVNGVRLDPTDKRACE